MVRGGGEMVDMGSRPANMEGKQGDGARRGRRGSKGREPAQRQLMQHRGGQDDRCSGEVANIGKGSIKKRRL